MAAITLKSLPPALHRALRSRAVRHKRSLNQEVIAMLEEAVAPAKRVDVETVIARTRALREGLKFTATPQDIDRFKREGRQ
jgi:plasmid stability protein